MKLNGNKGSHSHVPSGVPREEAAAPKKKGKGLRRALVTLGVIVVVVLGVVIGYSVWEKPPAVVGPGPAVSTTPKPDSSAAGDKQPDGTETPTPNPDGTETPTPTEEPVDEYEGALVTDRDDGVYTFLLVGRDHASNSTDTIIVGKFDTNKHTIDMVNIPRDTLINIDWCSSPKKINNIYPGYVNGGRPGMEGLMPEIKKILGFEPDFYAVVNLKVVQDVIDAIGGVYFDVPIPMHYDDYSQSFHVHLEPGYQKLSGYEALGVFRFRYGGVHNGVQTEGYPGGDVQRIGVQQDLLKAIAKQLLDLGNIPNLGKVIELCLANVETTLDASNMAFFARQFLKCGGTEAINFHEMPVSGYNMINGVSYVSIGVDGWIDLVNEKLNPYNKDITRYNLSILTGNYDGTYLESTSGTIAGGWESFYCQTCAMKNGWQAVWHVPGGCPPDELGPEEVPEGGEGTDVTDQTPPPDAELPVEPTPSPEVS